MSDFEKNMLEFIKPKSTVILGVSGGPDSVYLLYKCAEFSKKHGIKLIVAHVNHNLRGKESDRDEIFVKKLCKKMKIACYSKRVNLQNKSGRPRSINLEEAGRDARYKFFEQLRTRYRADWIILAHHLNDNIETMFFNLIRGANLNGLKGMNTALPSRHILRPMLGMTKKEVLDELQRKKIAYRFDESNENTDFSRNWLRKRVIPLFSKLNPRFEQTLAQTLKNLTDTSEYLEKQCEDWLQKHSKNPLIDLEAFLKEHTTFQKNILVYLYKKIHKSTNKLTSKHLEEILKVLQKRQSRLKKEFGTGSFITVVTNSLPVGSSKGHKKKKRYIRLDSKKW